MNPGDSGDRYPQQRHDLLCGDCGAPMVLRAASKSSTPFYACSRPECDGRLSAKADGAPKGSPANRATRRARVYAHKVFDQLWKLRLMKSRHHAYAWMRTKMRLSHSKAHIGLFNEAQCHELVRLVKEEYPQFRTRYDAILEE